MKLDIISLNDFDDYAKISKFACFHQTINYALLKSEHGYDYEIFGIKENNEIIGAFIMLIKDIGKTKYGYIPEGGLIDYDNKQMVSVMANGLKIYAKKHDISFIKINPSKTIKSYDPKTKKIIFNDNDKTLITIINSGFTKLKDNMYFESILPRGNAILNISDFKITDVSKSTRNKIRKSFSKGLIFEKSDISNIGYLESFIKNKINKDDFYYNDYLSIFEKSNLMDFFLIKVNYEKYVIDATKAYEDEVQKNKEYNYKVTQNPTERKINKKMNSDKLVISYKNDISRASKNMNKNEEYIAGALVVKTGDKVTILISGYNKEFKSYLPNYFLYTNLIRYYKGKYNKIDLNGISLDFSKENPYYGLNSFKFGWYPEILEYIGEFDLITNERNYNHLLKKGILAKEFNK